MVSLNDTRVRFYRHLKYAITRPDPPSSSAPLEGPVVVVGSAPISNKPVGFDQSFHIISINGSQSVIEAWGVEAPHTTFMMFNQIRGTNLNACEVRRVLSGRRTGELHLLLWRDGRQALEDGLRAFDYRYDHLNIINRYQRMALLDRVCGLRTAELAREGKCSNGINAVLFAIHNKAPAVIITGINPKANGHIYNQANLPRFHSDMDATILEKLVERRYPLFTADEEVATATGLPLWRGEIPLKRPG
jgi:hypothetical protein